MNCENLLMSLWDSLCGPNVIRGERERESSQVDKWRGEKAVKILPTAKSIRITIAVPSADVIVHGVFEQYLAWLSQNQPTYTALVYDECIVIYEQILLHKLNFG